VVGRVVVGVLGAVLATAAPARAAAQCRPFDGISSEQVVRGTTAQGPALTEYFAGGYRITQCDAAGQPRKAMVAARIATPTAEEPFVPVEVQSPGVNLFILYGDPREPRWAQAWLEHGGQATARVIPPLAPLPPGLDRRAELAARAPDDSCSNGQYVVSNRWSTRAYRYAAHAMSPAFRVAVTAGHHDWDGTENSCGYHDQANIASDFAGRTSRTIHSVADGVSVVDEGALANVCGSATALACTWTFTFSALGGLIGESDQRYGSRWPWSTSGAGGAYDIESVAAHETGHSIGLAHANSSAFLTMYHQTCAGCVRGRTLARGDVLGMRALYP
jgi:hypothetical protein